jgi:methionyl-tRNA formyltransferase
VPGLGPSSEGSLRVAFLGNARWSVTPLECVARSRHPVVLVATREPRPSGRGRALTPTPVADAARRLDLPLRELATVRDEAGLGALREAQPDVLAVVAYGEILSEGVLAVPRRMPINVHFSLLPALRGAAPVQRAIMLGLRETGVTTIRMEEGLDTGPILLQATTELLFEEDAGALAGRLARRGGELLVETLDRLAAGTLVETPQDEDAATYAAKITREDEVVDWSRSSDEISRQVRALFPAPGASTGFRGKRLKILRVSAEGGVVFATDEVPPGSLMATDNSLLVTTGPGPVGGWLHVEVIQPEGKRPMSAKEFVNGYRPEPGERLG